METSALSLLIITVIVIIIIAIIAFLFRGTQTTSTYMYKRLSLAQA